jgi:Bacteriophage minor capsid protein
MRLDLLAQYLQDQNLGVQGQTIFVHRMPANVTEGILLRAPLAGVKIDWNLPGYLKHEIQVIVRANVQDRGDTLAKQVSDALTLYRRTFNDATGAKAMFVHQMLPNALPIVYPRAANGQEIEWSINIDCNYTQF